MQRSRQEISDTEKEMQISFSVDRELAQGGYLQEWFLRQEVDLMTCPVCRKICHDPQSPLCGHSFCKTCIEPCEVCPICRGASDDLIPNRFMQTWIESECIRCPNAHNWRTQECTWTGKVMDLKAHLKTCALERVKCTVCHRQIFLSEEERHAEAHRLFSCPREHCEEWVCMSNAEAHEQTCMGKMETCGACGETTTRKHECKKASRVCVCGWKGLFEDYEKHWRLTDHREVAEKMAETTESTLIENHELKQHISVLSGQLHVKSLIVQTITKNMVVCLKTLKYIGANFDRPVTGPGNCPLHVAVELGRAEIASFLLDEHVSLHTKNKKGFTALDVACHVENEQLVEILIRRGAPITSIVYAFLFKRPELMTRVTEYL